MYLSLNVKKINRFGVKQDRILIITNLSIYHIKPSLDKTKKCIPLTAVDGITISSLDESQPSSDNKFYHGELLIHVDGSHDHRYQLGGMRDTVADLIRRLKTEIVDDKSLAYKLYRVRGRTVLKAY